MELNFKKEDLKENLLPIHIDKENEDNLEKLQNREMSLEEVFKISLKLGLTSFGGPIAHIGMFNQIFIKENKIISEKEFTQLFAICNIIPGPTSSQLITAIASVKTKSLIGGLISFLCFNMPALILMILIANLSLSYEINLDSFWMISILMGVWQAAVALVLQAAITLTKKVVNSNLQLFCVFISAFIYFIFNKFYVMILLMSFSGLLSLYKKEEEFLIKSTNNNKNNIYKMNFLGVPAFMTLLILYSLLLIFNYFSNNLTFLLMERFYRIGMTVIGGGHVVIPLTLSEFKNFIKEKDILNAFSIVSVLPGPMFNIAGYIGTLINGTLGGFLSALSIFTPGILLMLTALRFVDYLEKMPNLQFFIRGVSSAAIGFIFTSCFILWIDSCVLYVDYTSLSTLNVLFAYYLLSYRNFNVVLVLIISVIISILFNLI